MRGVIAGLFGGAALLSSWQGHDAIQSDNPALVILATITAVLCIFAAIQVLRGGEDEEE